MSSLYYCSLCVLCMCITVTYAIRATTIHHSKDPRCHNLVVNKECDVGLYEINDYEFQGYVFYKTFNVCKKYYKGKDTELCDANKDLFKTEEECLQLCGVKCKLPDNTSGICKWEKSCQVTRKATADPIPCGAYNVICCPYANSTSVV